MASGRSGGPLCVADPRAVALLYVLCYGARAAPFDEVRERIAELVASRAAKIVHALAVSGCFGMADQAAKVELAEALGKVEGADGRDPAWRAKIVDALCATCSRSWRELADARVEDFAFLVEEKGFDAG